MGNVTHGNHRFLRRLVHRFRVSAFASAMLLMPVVVGGAVPQAINPVCAGGNAAAVLVSVTGLKSGAGSVRVQAYGPGPANFLKKGAWARRLDVPLQGRTSLDVCLTLPAPGRFAIAVRHDANANGKSDWNDGGGFSRNPKLSLFRLRPQFEEVAIEVPKAGVRASMVMNYRRGLAISPIG